MFENEREALDAKVREFCVKNGLPDVKLTWRNIPFRGEWGIAAPLFPLAAAENRTNIETPVAQRDRKSVV